MIIEDKRVNVHCEVKLARLGLEMLPQLGQRFSLQDRLQGESYYLSPSSTLADSSVGQKTTGARGKKLFNWPVLTQNATFVMILAQRNNFANRKILERVIRELNLTGPHPFFPN